MAMKWLGQIIQAIVLILLLGGFLVFVEATADRPDDPLEAFPGQSAAIRRAENLYRDNLRARQLN
jgi:hypothetical protein